MLSSRSELSPPAQPKSKCGTCWLLLQHLEKRFQFDFHKSGFVSHLNNLGEESLSSPTHQTCVWYHLTEMYQARKSQCDAPPKI